MSQQLIQTYLNDLSDLKKYSGSSREGVVSEAFKDLLKACAKTHGLIFTPQYELPRQDGARRIIDGALLFDVRVPFGYWEAKDEADDIDAEIAAKLRRGYPRDNIIFEDSRTAVLMQNGNEVMRCLVTDTGKFERLLGAFFGYEQQVVTDFRKAVVQFRTDLPAVLQALRDKIDAAYAGNKPFMEAAEAFLKQAKQTINPAISEADIREMLIQHILTEEIFAHVFNDSDFHRDNNIAKALYKLEGLFFTGGVKKDTLRAVEPYYNAIKRTALEIDKHSEKQTFLKVIYETFYKVYNPKAADRLGVVYTPNEIVKFMIEGADWLCQKHFKKMLIDRDVQILDPATGTGTFICELLEHFRGQPEKLAYKYKEELHANEVAILPYYVANLNIEATYAAISGQYAEFPNLCFVDTLDNVAGLGIRSGHQHDMFGAIAEENAARIKRQNSRKISVVIGNPPYNANQQNENDNNKNREYARIDQRIKATYIKRSTAQKTKQYDMFVRFVRWASDRMHDDGVLAFITNRKFIDGRNFDGFRKVIRDEFDESWVVDLGGDFKLKGVGGGGNVFGIGTGVALMFLVRRKRKPPPKLNVEGKIFYMPVTGKLSEEKLSFLAANSLGSMKPEHIKPDEAGYWIDLPEEEFDESIAIASKSVKKRKLGSINRAIFENYSLGISTNRDQWVYDIDKNILKKKISFLSYYYSQISIENMKLDKNIKWSSTLRQRKLASKIELDDWNLIKVVSYRPFSKIFFYQSSVFVDRPGWSKSNFPTEKINYAICFNDIASRGSPCILAVDGPADLHFGTSVDAYQQVSRYRYTPEGERIDNITDWALKEFHKAYGRSGAGSPSPLAGEGGTRSVTDEGSSEANLQAKSVRNGGMADTVPLIRPSLTRRPPSPTQIGLARSGQIDVPTSGKPDVGAGEGKTLTKDAIFHYVYGVLHDPVYREKYALNLKREFPRVPFYPDFWQWAEWGEQLMALHIGYETVEPWPLERRDVPDTKARTAGVSPKVSLRADRDAGLITLDSETVLAGIPAEVWDYKLGNRSALDWILDQHKEKTPKDATIREKFNTYRFADYKEKVVDLLLRVTRVSVETVAITEAMKRVER